MSSKEYDREVIEASFGWLYEPVPCDACVYCGEAATSGRGDHVPAFWHAPLMPDLKFGMLVPCCARCNNRLGACPDLCLVDRAKRLFSLGMIRGRCAEVCRCDRCNPVKAYAAALRAAERKQARAEAPFWDVLKQTLGTSRAKRTLAACPDMTLETLAKREAQRAAAAVLARSGDFAAAAFLRGLDRSYY